MSVLDVLKAAREQLRDPEKWCMGASTEGGRACAVNTIALLDGFERGFRLMAMDALDKHAARLFSEPAGATEWLAPMANVNDNLGHAAVLAVYDAAIDELEPATLQEFPAAEPCGD